MNLNEKEDDDEKFDVDDEENENIDDTPNHDILKIDIKNLLSEVDDIVTAEKLSFRNILRYREIVKGELSLVHISCMHRQRRLLPLFLIE